METVLTHGARTARFDGSRLEVVEDRTTWTVPVQAVQSARLDANGHVRIEISGDDPTAEHGLSNPIVLASPDDDAAAALVSHLRAARQQVRPVADGHSLVTVKVKRRGPEWPTWPFLGIFLALVLARTLFASWIAPVDGLALTLILLFWSVMGALLLRRIWRRRIRPLRVLRRHGVAGTAEVVGHLAFGSTKGSPLWGFDRLRFTTARGLLMPDVVSVVSVKLWSSYVGATVDIVYDPRNPNLASRPLTVAFMFRTAVVIVLGLGMFILPLVLLVSPS